MKKSIKIRIICLIIASATLMGAFTVSAVNGSPYEALKNAFFNAIAYENFTFEGEWTIIFNGELYNAGWRHFVQNDNSVIEFTEWWHLPQGRSFTEFGGNRDFEGSLDERFWYFYSDGITVRLAFAPPDGTRWYSATGGSSVNVRRRWQRNINNPLLRRLSIRPIDRNSAQVRFAELFIDLLARDLKNNMHISQNDGIRRVSGSITYSQLPEIIKLGIEMSIEEELRRQERNPRLWEEIGVWEFTREGFASANIHPLDIPIQSRHFNIISFYADIDSSGNLLYLNIGTNMTIVNIFDDIHNIEFSMIYRFSDIDISVPVNPVPGALELFTHEFFEREFGRRYNSSIYFTRNENGSINPESITSTFPGHLPEQRERTRNALIAELETMGIDFDLLRLMLDEAGLDLDELLKFYIWGNPSSIDDFLIYWIEIDIDELLLKHEV